MGHWCTCPPQVLEIVCILHYAVSLTVKISKITKEECAIHFRLSRLKHAKNSRRPTQIKTVSESKRNPGQRRRGKIHIVPPSPHFLVTPLIESLSKSP